MSTAAVQEASRKVLKAALLRRREKALAIPARELALLIMRMFVEQTYAMVGAIVAAEVPSEGERRTEAVLAAALAALRRRDTEDRQNLRDGYRAAVLASLDSSAQRFGIYAGPDDIGAQKWADQRAQFVVEAMNQTTVDRLQKPLTKALREPDSGRNEAAAAVVGAISIKLAERAAGAAATESLYAYGWADVAYGELFADAGIAMLKQWYHTDACPCPICNSNDGQIVPVDGLFSSGHAATPAHPNCRCFVDVYPDPQAKILTGALVLGQVPLLGGFGYSDADYEEESL